MPPAMPIPAPPSLSTQDWARVSALFDLARDLPQADLPAWQARLAADEPALAPFIAQMLQAHRSRADDDWLERGPRLKDTAAALKADGLQPGARIGPWVLGALLGSGGMATVWRATRADALPAREVALKLPLTHRAGSQLAARFARERDILARLAHPHIAPLYDAGVGEDGTPWLAMECVDGLPIARWCDERHLGLTARVALFTQVLEAVQYAHGRLVMHRDLKPSNILVTPDGQVRLLDFGIAKLLDPVDGHTEGVTRSRVDATELTQAAGRVLTPAYAAPEQLRGEALTTATDIHALGVVLYELLCGSRPYRTQLDSPAQLEQAILEGDAPRASSQASAAAAALRGTSAVKLARELRGDLDTILAKTLRSDPRQRYPTALAFADDLRRWAAREPVLARPDSRSYRLRRFLRRHRAGAAATAVVLVTLLAALTVSLLQARRADRERDNALAARGTSVSVSRLLMDQMVAIAAQGRAVPLPEMLDRAEAAARNTFDPGSEALADALFTIGAQRRNFVGDDAGAATLRQSLAIAREPSLRAEVTCDLAAAIYSHATKDEALAMTARAIADPAVSPGARASCLDYQVLLQMAGGDLAGALQSQEAAWAIARAALDMPTRARDREEMMLAYLRAVNGSPGAVDAVFERVQAKLQAAGHAQALPAIELRSRWAAASMAMGNARRAVALITQNLQLAQAQVKSPAQARYSRSGGLAQEALGHDDQALALFAAAAARAQADGEPAVAAASRCAAVPAQLRQGQVATAAPAVAQALQLLPPGLTAIDEAQRICTMAQAELALAQGRAATAEAVLKTLLDEPRLAQHHRADALMLRSRAALAAGKTQQAVADAQAALQGATQMQGQLPQSFRVALAQAALGDALAAAGDRATSGQAYAAADTQFAATVDATHPRWLQVQQQQQQQQQQQPR